MAISETSNNTCMSTRHTNFTTIGNQYEGIPETLVLNVVSWCVLLILFAILRNRAWDYGRLALVQNEKWTQLFYKVTEEEVSEESRNDSLLSSDVGCSWLPTIFTVNKQRIFARCGPDAVHYLSFQLHLLVLMFTITIFAICVILPINFQGTLQGNKYTFGHTTISNLDPHSNWFWFHIIASFCFVPLTIMIMRRCSSRIPNATLVSSRTVMVTHISRIHRNTDDIRNYFSVRYPNINITDIQIAHRVKKLMKIEEERVAAKEALAYCMAHKPANLQMKRHGCIICCPCKTEDAEQYYSQIESERKIAVNNEKSNIVSNPLGICFVTVTTEDEAKFIVDTFMPGTIRLWNITRAPSPSDINWENLEISNRHWYSKAIIINFVLFILLFFLTTPLMVVSMINSFTIDKEEFIKTFSPVLSEFLPTLLLLTVSGMMPVLVSYSDQWMSHWTKSKQYLATMRKTFFFLLFMVLILPSLGLTSAQAFVEWSLQTKNMTLRWECVFLPDKGAFFVNYVITSALIGTALELLRFPELAMYVWRLLWMKSKAEKITIRKQILSTFPFGIHYAWSLLIFTVATVYSLICPLITPFGLLYLCLKHFVDKHNIYYVYQPITMSEEGQDIHSSAVRMVRIAVMLLQAIMAAFTTIRGGLSLMAIVTMLGLVATAGFFFILSPFPSCRPRPKNTRSGPFENERYIAPVLISSESVSTVSLINNHNNYGSSIINNGDGIVLSQSRPGSSMA